MSTPAISNRTLRPRRRRPAARQPAPARRPASGLRATRPRNSIVVEGSRVVAHHAIPLGNSEPGFWQYPLNPFLRGPAWWTRYAQLFDKFRFTHIRVSYRPAVSSMSNGSVAIYYDPGAAPATPTFTSVSQSYASIITSVHLPATRVITRAELLRLPWYDSHTASADGTNGTVIAAWTGIAASPPLTGGSAWGYIELEYHLETSIPSAIWSTPAPDLTINHDSNNNTNTLGLTYYNLSEPYYIDDVRANITWIVPTGASNHSWPRDALQDQIWTYFKVTAGSGTAINAARLLFQIFTPKAGTGLLESIIRLGTDQFVGTGVRASAVPGSAANGAVPLDVNLTNSVTGFTGPTIARIYTPRATTRDRNNATPVLTPDHLAELCRALGGLRRLRYVDSHAHLNHTLPTGHHTSPGETPDIALQNK